MTIHIVIRRHPRKVNPFVGGQVLAPDSPSRCSSLMGFSCSYFNYKLVSDNPKSPVSIPGYVSSLTPQATSMRAQHHLRVWVLANDKNPSKVKNDFCEEVSVCSANLGGLITTKRNNH